MFIIFKAKSEDWEFANLVDECHEGSPASSASYYDWLKMTVFEGHGIQHARDRQRSLVEKTKDALEKLEKEGWVYDRPISCSNDETILTAWSGFSYGIIRQETDLSGVFCYEGAEHGFLAQELIPVFEDIETVYVTGSYGTYTGKDGLNRYKAVKRQYEELAKRLVEEVPNLPSDDVHYYNGWARSEGVSKMSVTLFKMGLDPDPNAEPRSVREARLEAERSAREAAYREIFGEDVLIHYDAEGKLCPPNPVVEKHLSSVRKKKKVARKRAV